MDEFTKELLTPRIELNENILHVRALLAKSNIRQVDLIRKYGINKTALSLVLSGRRKTTHIRRAIAQELGMGFAELWSQGFGLLKNECKF